MIISNQVSAGASVDGALQSCFEAQRRAFAAEPNPTVAVRRSRLDRLLMLTEHNEDAIVAAIADDFGTRSPQETRLAELFMVTVGIRHARRHLARWMRQRPVPTPLYLQPGRSYLVRQPLGVVGIISPWNYPFQLAIAAGGCGARGRQPGAAQTQRVHAADVGSARAIDRPAFWR